MKNKNLAFWVVIAVIILATILVIYWPSSQGGVLDEATMNCITQNSQLYVLTNCPHCSQQKQILGNYLDLFNVIDCIDNQQACIDAGVRYVPAWQINGELHTGVFELEELKEMTHC